jgi:hypothetical protein
MKTSGIILELNKKQALIMTDEVGFMAIRRKPGMFIGEQVDIGPSGLKKPGFNRYYYSLGLASIAVFMSILLWGINYSGQNKLYAYVSVDINPSIEFAVSKKIRIISVKGLNRDGMALLRGANFKNMPVDKALLMLVNKAEQNKYFHNKNGKNVLIAAVVKTEPVKRVELLAESIQKVEEKLKKRDIHLQFIQATLTQRRIALQNNLSTGRYVLSNTATDNGQLVDLNQAKTVPISILIKKAGLIRKPKVGSVIKHESFHNRATGPKVKNRAGNNNSIGSDSNSNDGKKEKNKMDSNIYDSKVKHNSSGSRSTHSGNAKIKSNSSSNPNSNDGKKEKNKMDSNIYNSKVKHNSSGSRSTHSGNAKIKSNSSSNPNSNDGKKEKNKMDSNIYNSKVKHNSSGSKSTNTGNSNIKSNSSSNGSNSHSGWSGSKNNSHGNSGKK